MRFLWQSVSWAECSDPDRLDRSAAVRDYSKSLTIAVGTFSAALIM